MREGDLAQQQPQRNGRLTPSGGAATWGVAAVMLAAAGWMAFGPHDSLVPLTPGPTITAAQIPTAPVRVRLTDPPTIKLGGYARDCQDCHRLFQPAASATPRPMIQHTDIVMRHGINTACLNCHDAGDRNRLALRGRQTVGYDQVELLCGQCHGLTYRDWQKGMHGRTNGYWNAAMGQPRRLLCTDCHDPHAPAFRPMKPLPSPNTLRMGDQTFHAPPASSQDPLRKWMRGGHDTPAESAAAAGEASAPGEVAR